MPQVKAMSAKQIEALALQAGVALIAESGQIAAGMIQAQAPVRTGALQASVHAEPPELSGKGVAVVVSTGAEVSDYAVPVHEGAAPHVILPKNAQALHFNGRFAAKVNHPGNAANPFFVRGIESFRSTFAVRAALALRKVF